MPLQFQKLSGRPAWMPQPLTLMALGWFALTTVVLLVLFRDAAERALRMWIDIPTYSYAFLLVPISVYLAVQKAGYAMLPRVAPSPMLLLLQVPIGIAWYAAVAAEIIEIQQFCLLAAIYVTFAALFGLRLVRAHFVALLLLGFLVPSGQFLLMPLQVLSAKIAAGLLRVAGAPLFLDGVVIQMPEGGYNVEPGCAGLNFVLVTIVLGLIVGELFYRTLFKKVAVIVGLLAVALVANPVRIFGIIYIDWLTNRTTDIVSDHLTYGWAFFAAILAVVLPFALRYRDDTETAAEPPAIVVEPDTAWSRATRNRLAVTAIAGIVLVAIAPLGLVAVASGAVARSGLPALTSGSEPAPPGAWKSIDRAIVSSAATYQLAGQRPVTAEVILRLAPTPRMRLVDRWQPEGHLQLRFVDVAQTELGEVPLYQSGGIGDKTLWVGCFLVRGACYPAPGGLRRAVLVSLARDPLARAGVIALSQPAPLEAAGSRTEQFRPLLAALSRVVATVAPSLAGGGK